MNNTIINLVPSSESILYMKYLLLFIFPFIIANSCGDSTKQSIMTSENNTTQTIFINSFKKECIGVGPMECMLIQRSDSIDPDAWEFFYDEIDGFDFEPGYIYKLKLKLDYLNPENIPTDASSIKYTLIEVLEKNIDKRMRINDIWALTAIDSDQTPVKSIVATQKHPVLEINISDMKFYGNDGCNSIQGSIKKLHESALEFSEISSTRMACPNMQLPLHFLQALENTKSFKIQELELTLYSKENKELLRFKKVD